MRKKFISIDTLTESDPILSDHGEGNPETKLIELENKKNLIDTLRKLKPQDRRILNLYFGLTDTPKKQKQIAKELKISRQAIGKRLKQAIKNLKKIMSGAGSIVAPAEG